MPTCNITITKEHETNRIEQNISAENPRQILAGIDLILNIIINCLLNPLFFNDVDKNYHEIDCFNHHKGGANQD